MPSPPYERKEWGKWYVRLISIISSIFQTSFWRCRKRSHLTIINPDRRKQQRMNRDNRRRQRNLKVMHKTTHSAEGRALEDGASSGMSSSNDDPYALAWRFLGVFIDCANDNYNQEDNSSCQRILLWAGYRNKAYNGNAIGEYSFYDWRTKSWDTSTCDLAGSQDCTRLDCHLVQPENFELVGVYKEIDGLDDWADQLFKHQAYCVWGEDQNQNDNQGNNAQQQQDDYYYSGSTDYEFMQSFVGDWEGGCDQIDDEGGLYYVDTMPLQGGNLVYGLYTDAACRTAVQDASLSYSEYLRHQQDNENGSNQKQAEALEAAWGRWNDLLNDFKVCQPCRAYSRVSVYQDDDDSQEQEENEEYQEEGDEEEVQEEEEEQDNDEAQRHRFLDEGNGDEEPNGFDCYDDAGYLNCNQCYKFESMTDLEEATLDDLELASSQGTILPIIVNGKQYGQGRGTIDSYSNTMNSGIDAGLAIKLALVAFWATVVIVMALWVFNRRDKPKREVRSNKPRRRRFFWGKRKGKGLLDNF